ncbi:MAG: bifunctional 3,4-dihydroxy-2-butanone-4-phosphate synthase/GTP cyclohydrolase II [Deferrisomatales bacterium]|nr:bifunctional 3,4-dihydroxy-2-butanone-4-phosphate synthase/GTP cyclohydrolase II [Deferrisomatales bacterium]
MPIQRVEAALKDFQDGKMVIMVDDEDRENEGDLTIAAEKITPEAINFMATHGRGLICLALSEDRCDALNLPPMVQDNTSSFQTAFTVSIEARQGVSTGISAADRATTVLAAIADDARPEDLARPGHVFPLRARRGGVLVRTGQTEGSMDLARLAGMKPAAVICEIMKDDGAMARRPDLEVFAAKHGLRILSIADLIEYRLRMERLIHRAAETRLPTAHGGEFKAIVYQNEVDSYLHIALVKGELDGGEPVLVRVHSECLTGDVFGSLRCDCGDQLHTAMRMIGEEGRGAIVYLHQEGRGIGIINKLKAYELQDQGRDTVEANEELGFQADLRDYGIGAQILVDLGIRKIRLMTNNPRKIVGIEGYGLEVVDRVSIQIAPQAESERYLSTKRVKLGHLLEGAAPEID